MWLAQSSASYITIPFSWHHSGLQVRLLYRDEATVPEKFKGKVELVKGNATNLDDVRNVLKGVEGVCIVLGTRNKVEPTTELSTGTQNVITAMKELGLNKVSACLSSFLFYDESKVPPVFHNINAEHKKMLETLKSSGFDYVAVLPPHIADEPSGEFQVKHDAAPEVRVISKYDLGKFLIDSLEQPEHYKSVCSICKKS